MSQTDTEATAESTKSNQSPDKSLTERVTAIHERLEALEADDVADMDDVDLVELRTEVKALEDTVDDVRSDMIDGELKDRIEPGESMLGLNHIESHSKYVAEDAGAVIMRAVGQGIDYTSFVEIKASTLAKEHPDLAEIGRAEYTYLR